jgi:hypothetical protein
VIMSAETFTRLTLATPEGGAEEKVELAVDWRAHDPVQLAVGPVLHSDDAVANKVCALFGRARRANSPPFAAAAAKRLRVAGASSGQHSRTIAPTAT